MDTMQATYKKIEKKRKGAVHWFLWKQQAILGYTPFIAK